MNNFEKVEYSRNLYDQAEKLTRELVGVRVAIRQQEKSCSHVLVNLGSKGTTKYERCLLCGQQSKKERILASKYCVNAENYLLGYNMNDKSQCDKKFDNIQTLALGLLRNNPNMTEEELTIELNNLIQGHIDFIQNNGMPKLVKIH